MRIVCLTGAGLSAESGLGTFRDAGGLWSRYDLNDVATPRGFARNPAMVHDFYNARRANCRTAQPNAGHLALVRLEAAMGNDLLIVTQNVDDLHERAGSVSALHMHGSLMGALCQRCDARWPAPQVMHPTDACPECGAHATRPDVVWFGEMPYHMERIAQALDSADMFVAIGTSGTVYPAAGFVDLARAAGAETVEINLTRSEGSHLFDRHITGPASQAVPAFVRLILGA